MMTIYRKEAARWKTRDRIRWIQLRIERDGLKAERDEVKELLLRRQA